ncbi:conserved hypothetical protein, partial [Ricinus communis]
KFAFAVRYFPIVGDEHLVAKNAIVAASYALQRRPVFIQGGVRQPLKGGAVGIHVQIFERRAKRPRRPEPQHEMGASAAWNRGDHIGLTRAPYAHWQIMFASIQKIYIKHAPLPRNKNAMRQPAISLQTVVERENIAPSSSSIPSLRLSTGANILYNCCTEFQRNKLI